MSRPLLVEKARGLSVERPEVMTRIEMVDEILRLTTEQPEERRRVRGFLGVARDLIASVVEQGLNLPDAAALIRGDLTFEPLRPPQRPVATVTLAEIYGAQGHFDIAVGNLDEVLQSEPDHEAAKTLRAELVKKRAAREGKRKKAAKKNVSTAAEHPAEDALITMALPGGRTYVYWEIGAKTAKRVDSGSRALVKLAAWTPDAAGAVRADREVVAAGRVGGAVVDGLGAPAVVRAALGLADNGHFRPLSVAAEAKPAKKGQPELCWRPRERPDYASASRRAADHLKSL